MLTNCFTVYEPLTVLLKFFVSLPPVILNVQFIVLSRKKGQGFAFGLSFFTSS